MRKVRIVTIILFVVVAVLYIGSLYWEKNMVDRRAPVISCPQEVLEVSVHDPDEALLADVTALDDRDGDLSAKVIVGGISKLITEDTARVTYYVFDRSDNMASSTRMIRYTDYSRPVISLTRPLIFAAGESVSLTDRLTAQDVIDGDISDRIHVSTTDIVENTEGTYQISVFVTNSLGDSTELKLPLTITADGLQSGEVLLSDYLVYVEQGASFDPSVYPIGAVLANGRSTSLSGLDWSGDVDTETPGLYVVTYTCKGYNGRTLTAALIVVVE